MLFTRLALFLTTLSLAACGGPVAVPLMPVPDEPRPAPAPPAPEPPAPAPDPDPAPEHLGTPAASKEAAPAWWLKWYRKEQLPEYAPQPDAAWELFRAAGSAPRKVERIQDALLACHVKAGAFFEQKGVQLIKPGAFSKADLQVMARVTPASGKPGKVTTIKGKQDTNEVTFTVPLCRLDKGDALELRILDRDFIRRGLIEKLALPFSGGAPLLVRGKKAMAECRLVDRAMLEERLKVRLKKLDGKLDRFEAAFHPDLSGRNLYPNTGPGSHLDFIRADVGYPAALVGWDDPRVAKRVKRLADLEARFAGELKELLTATWKNLPAAGQWTPLLDGEVEARQIKKLCGAKVVKPYLRLIGFGDERKALSKQGCVVHVKWRNTASPGPISFNLFSHNLDRRLEDFKVIGADGSKADAKILGVVGRRGRLHKPRKDPVLKPGHTLEAAYVLPTRGPYLLQGAFQKVRLRLVRDRWTALNRGKIQLKLTALICGDELERQKKRYVYPLSGTHSVEDLGCVLQVRVRNKSAAPITMGSLPDWTGIRRISLVTGGPVNIHLQPLAHRSGESYNSLSELKVSPGQTADLLLAPGDDPRKLGIKTDTSSLLLQADFARRQVDHIKLK